MQFKFGTVSCGKMKVGVGFGNNPDSAIAGRQAAMQAVSQAKSKLPCDLVLLFCTARHDQEILRNAVAQTVGNSNNIYGGGAAGIITNDVFGYAGDQVGVACIWLEDDDCKATIVDGLLESEVNTGMRLGQQLNANGIRPDSPVMLFYDAVDRTQGNLRLIMATWILEGIEKGLGFLPDLTGAGLQGDHMCTPTRQYLGNKIGEHSAIALSFSDNIYIDHAIMHGCQPASPYYTVTKADGPVILEINGKPALAFIDGMLGPELKPEDYPFFLLFGINRSGQWESFDEDNYASRLCLGVDLERNGIIMFEPDMHAGTQFQIMSRSLGLDYIQPKIDRLFEKLEAEKRDPFFIIYINCAGRCAGYGGVEMEDAYVILKAVKNDIPLLGLYTGVEIASGGYRPRGLDWTGVFCVFSKGEPRDLKKACELYSADSKEKVGEDAAFTTEGIKKLAERNAAKMLWLDAKSIAIRHELEQKRLGFSLLAEFSVDLRQESIGADGEIFTAVAQHINAALNMQRTVLLFPDTFGAFTVAVSQGYTAEEKERFTNKQIFLDEELLDAEKPVLVTAEDDEALFANLRETLSIAYFISVPVIVENRIAAILITGRNMETTPFLSRLSNNDVETVQAVSALLGYALMREELDVANKLAQTDVLTGLFNRREFELKTTESLRKGLTGDKVAAFIMIDTDFFKEVNDKYGHLVGDATLKRLAEALLDFFRATDIIARLGGDEFAVYCAFPSDISPIIKRVSRLVQFWRATPLIASDGVTFNSSLSIGISFAPRDGITYNELLHKADIALYESKRNGRDQFTVYDENTMKDIQPQT
ncbi:diguanylate cyclase [Eubacteriales bacterium OttesenSCG-928-K08]|nr:diguanylate cyclase [Eubacteriales bacterium OttesenSCG-928-K08]